jgi:nitrogenase molybdenum-iron protein alpha/beta subunit
MLRLSSSKLIRNEVMAVSSLNVLSGVFTVVAALSPETVFSAAEVRIAAHTPFKRVGYETRDRERLHITPFYGVVPVV